MTTKIAWRILWHRLRMIAKFARYAFRETEFFYVIASRRQPGWVFGYHSSMKTSAAMRESTIQATATAAASAFSALVGSTRITDETWRTNTKWDER